MKPPWEMTWEESAVLITIPPDITLRNWDSHRNTIEPFVIDLRDAEVIDLRDKEQDHEVEHDPVPVGAVRRRDRRFGGRVHQRW